MQSMAQFDTAGFFGSRPSMPTSMGAKELARLDPIIRQRSFFSAKVECGELLGGIRKFVQECIAEGTTEGEFLHRVNQWLWENAQFLGEDFPNAKVRSGEWGDEEARRYERSVRHIDSLARLRLIFRTQAEMCAGFSDFQRDMEPQALADYPGWKFVRNPGAKTFRKDHVEHQGEVRLKTDFDYWLARNDPSFGGFNNPYPPFGFNSWMWTSPVSRAKCVRLGLIAEGEEVSLSDGQRKQWGLDGKHAVEAVQKMLDRLCKYPQEEPGDSEYGYDAMDGYRKSKDRAEAIERSKQLVDEGGTVSYHDTITQEQIDEFNAIIERLLDKYGMGKLTGMGSGVHQKDGVGAWVGGNKMNLGGITLNNDRTTGGVHGLKYWTSYDMDKLAARIKKGGEYIEKWKKEIESLSAGESWRRFSLEYLIKDTKKQLKKDIEKQAFGRHNVGATENGITIQSIVTHEFGHVIHFRAYGGMYAPMTSEAQRAQTIIKNALKKARMPDKSKHKDIFNLSQYANKDEIEFFAECFTAREIGEQVPDYISEMLDDVIAIAKKTPKK